MSGRDGYEDPGDQYARRADGDDGGFRLRAAHGGGAARGRRAMTSSIRANGRRGLIDLLVGQDIFGKTLGIFGMGRIGQAVARRAHGFSMRVLYCDELPAADEITHELGLERVSKEELLAESDFVSLHVPLLPETRHLIGAAELRRMKPTAILMNTARGAVVDEAAVAEALRDGTIAYAGLDVFENEPEVRAGLLNLKNVVLAPHIASASVDTRRKMSMMAAENAISALAGRRPPNLLNPQLWERLPR